MAELRGRSASTGTGGSSAASGCPPRARRTSPGTRYASAAPNREWRRVGTDRLLRLVLRVLDEYAAAHPARRAVGIGDLSRPGGGDFGSRFGGHRPRLAPESGSTSTSTTRVSTGASSAPPGRPGRPRAGSGSRRPLRGGGRAAGVRRPERRVEGPAARRAGAAEPRRPPPRSSPARAGGALGERLSPATSSSCRAPGGPQPVPTARPPSQAPGVRLGSWTTGGRAVATPSAPAHRSSWPAGRTVAFRSGGHVFEAGVEGRPGLGAAAGAVGRAARERPADGVRPRGGEPAVLAAARSLAQGAADPRLSDREPSRPGPDPRRRLHPRERVRGHGRDPAAARSQPAARARPLGRSESESRRARARHAGGTRAAST